MDKVFVCCSKTWEVGSTLERNGLICTVVMVPRTSQSNNAYFLLKLLVLHFFNLKAYFLKAIIGSRAVQMDVVGDMLNDCVLEYLCLHTSLRSYRYCQHKTFRSYTLQPNR